MTFATQGMIEAALASLSADGHVVGFNAVSRAIEAALAEARAAQSGECITEARRIYREYSDPDSQIDNGNLFWALGAALDALAAAPPAPAAEPVAWEYRWLNPAGEPNPSPASLRWYRVEPRNSLETLEDRLRELRGYRWTDGKPIYEVRALGVIAPPPVAKAAEPVAVALKLKIPAERKDAPMYGDEPIGEQKSAWDYNAGWNACRAAMIASAPPPVEASQQADEAIALIAAERARQVHSEGWTRKHDDAHDDGDLAAAAACYAWRASLSNIRRNSSAGQEVPDGWPWDRDWWKPASDNSTAGKVRELVKAGALIVAEIERLQRAEASQQQYRCDYCGEDYTDDAMCCDRRREYLAAHKQQAAPASGEKVVHIEGYDEWRAKQGSDERAARIAFVSQKVATQMVAELRGELSRLTAELAAAKADALEWAGIAGSIAKQRDDANAEAEALRKDAERWQWRKDNPTARLVYGKRRDCEEWRVEGCGDIRWHPTADAAIDAAIAAQQGKGGEG